MDPPSQPKITSPANPSASSAARRVGLWSATGVVTLLAVAIIVVVATGFTPSRSRLLDGGAWLADDTNMPHASGPNAAVDSAVQACPEPDDCRWVQRDGLAYLVQPRTGQVHRLDTSTRRFDQQGVAIGAADSRLLVGTGHVYSIDQGEQSVVSRDPVTLAPRGEPMHPAGGAGDAMVDRSGLLWIVETGTGNVLGIDDTVIRYTIHVGDTGQGLAFGSIDDTPVVLDPHQRLIVTIDERGREVRRLPLEGFDAGRTVLGRDLPTGPLFFVEKGSGRIGRLSLESGAVETVGTIDVGDDVTAVYVVGTKVFVTQPATGTVRWYSLDTRQEREPIGEATEVFVKDGFLFANDVHAREAHVAGPDSDPQVVLKRRDDIPKGEVDEKVDNYSPTPPEVTTTTIKKSGDGAEPPERSSTTSTPPSSSTSTTTPASSTTLPAADVPPSPPTNVSATGGDAQATVKWNTSQGGVDHYEIEPAGDSPGFATQTSGTGCAGGDCSVTIRGLTNGSTYTFVVFAVSTKGTRSTASQPSNAVQVAADLPADPGSVSAVGLSKTKVRVSWTAAPANGRAITEYIVQPLTPGKQATGSAFSTGNTTLDVDVPSGAPATYYFRVQAKNDAGRLSSGAISPTPVGPYGPPSQVSVATPSTSGCTQQPDNVVTLNVSWNGVAFPDGDTARGYELTLNGAQPQKVDANTTTRPVDVASGRSSRIEVAAVNETGKGPAGSITVTCPTVDPTGGVLELSSTPAGTGQVTVNASVRARPIDPSDPAKAGSTCCFVSLTDARIQVKDTALVGGLSSASLDPSRPASTTIDISTLTTGTYTFELRSTGGEVLASVAIVVTGSTTSTTAFAPDPPGPIRTPASAPGAAAVRRDDQPDVFADLLAIRRNDL